MDRLTFAVLSDSLAEMRRVTARCGRNERLTLSLLQHHFSIWERGILLNAASFLLDFPEVPFDIPARAFFIAQRVVSIEFSHGYAEDLVAASMGGAPWRSSFPAACLHCGRSATWRQIVKAVASLPLETCWRYERPENHLPMCRRCITRLAYRSDESRIELIRALWGARFEAFYHWHKGFEQNKLPHDWDPGLYPLWPADFGGDTWASGSGSLANSEPQMFYGVLRSPCHKQKLSYFLGTAQAAEITSSHDEIKIEPVYHQQDASYTQTLGVQR